MVEKKFDVVVIGSGPGGYKASKLLLERGYRVCLVEKGVFRGTCLNAGCIPKDVLYNIAVSLTKLKQLFGKEISISWEDAVRTAQERVVHLRESAKEYLQRKGLKIVYGEGELVDEKVVKVRNMKLIGNHIILACGSRQKEEGVSPEDLLTGGK
ncbi:MAG: FAD-dependent oxidoreductase [Aquificota bacterium]|nr:FAD-dependent oxidoreductase [Aquificota bacterium]